MSPTRLQDWFDLVTVASRQRWMLGIGAVASAGAASVFASMSDTQFIPLVTAIVAMLAVISAVQPSSQTGLLVLVGVVWQWLATADDPMTAWLIGVAISLFTFHVTIALMAVTPHTSTVGPEVLLLWLGRVFVVATCTVGVWVLALAFDGWTTTGSTLLTVTAFVALTAATVAVRAVTVDDSEHP